MRNFFIWLFLQWNFCFVYNSNYRNCLKKWNNTKMNWMCCFLCFMNKAAKGIKLQTFDKILKCLKLPLNKHNAIDNSMKNCTLEVFSPKLREKLLLAFNLRSPFWNRHLFPLPATQTLPKGKKQVTQHLRNFYFV